MKAKKRTLVAETPNHIGKVVTVKGWVDSKRDHGKVTFIDLRDRSGKLQVVGVKKLSDLTVESVVEITGTVRQREKQYINPDLATGEIELEASEYTLLNKCEELPISLDGDGLEINEVPRLRYRYIDLRRQRMQNILRMRSKLNNALREILLEQDFVEIETPLLTKSTKEGARDFIVPSRFQPGKFYALPQSPQQYKQLLMTAGFERYFQLARCIRDEDLRADRGFEFTQLDIEMSFATQQQVMDTVEDMVVRAVKQVGGNLQTEKFPVFTYEEAMEKYGADKFDIRTEEEKKQGKLAFCWVVDFPFFKKVDKKDAAEVRDSKSGWTFTHNPFSTPQPQCVKDHLEQKNIDKILTAQYDLVCNGYEIGGGSIRAHQPEVLKTTFKIMGYSDEEIEASVGHMIEAFRQGTPPHGGIALGMDRLVMLLAQEESLKETIAFPMTSSGRTAVMDAPSPVGQDQLDELGIKVAQEEEQSVHDQILSKLNKQGVSYQYLVHQPVMSSEEAAKVRGTSLQQAAKALVLQADKEFILYVLPGDQRADLDQLQKHLGVKKLAMASRDSVFQKTGVKVGAVPPFGSFMSLKTYLAAAMQEQEKIAFNAGDHERSVIMELEDYLRLEKPEVVE